MFSYTGLTPQQVHALQHKYHVYLLKSGRASISGCKGPPWDKIEFELTIVYSEPKECRLRRTGD